MEESNNAILTVSKSSIITIETAEVVLKLDKPASNIEFNLTYNSNVFSFLPGSVLCALPWKNIDYSKPGIIVFKAMSQDPNITATSVSLSFMPLQAVPLSGFITNGLVTNTGATLTVPTVNVSITALPLNLNVPPAVGSPVPPMAQPQGNPPYIIYVPTLPLNPNVPPAVGSPVPSMAQPQGNPPYIVYVYTLPLNPNVGFA